MNKISVMTFSKDRAPQLEALLRSVKDHVTGYHNYHVLYTYSNDEQGTIYDDINTYKQASIKKDN